MKGALGVAVVAVMILSAASASAASTAAPRKPAGSTKPKPTAPVKHTCAITLQVGQVVASRTIECRYKNSDPQAYVGVKALSTYTLSDHDHTIAFYGRGVVVRLHQTGKLVHISAVSVSGQRYVHVVLKRGVKRSGGFGKGHGHRPTGKGHGHRPTGSPGRP